MLSTFTERYRPIIWVVLFAFTFYSIPNLGMIISQYELDIRSGEAQAAEAETADVETPSDTQATEAPTVESQTESQTLNEKTAELLKNGKEVKPTEKIKTSNKAATTAIATASAMAAGEESGGGPDLNNHSSISFKVDDFTGAAHMSYTINVPPGRNGMAPQISLSYASSGGNGWLGTGWDLSFGSIMRKGPRNGVPTYDDTKDTYILNLGGAQELVSIGNNEYRLKIEGGLYKIKYYPAGNYWESTDKTGLKVTFGSTASSRIGKVKEPDAKTNTYSWFIDRVEDPMTNYMEYIYFRDQDASNTYDIYPQEIRYNGQVSGNLAHNHRILFNLETTNRPDPTYNYRAGFKMVTKKRLASVEVLTNGNPVRKYTIEYAIPNVKSVLTKITPYGSDYQSNPNPVSLPPTTFTYQSMDKQNANNRGFGSAASWSNPSMVNSIDGNLIRNLNPWGYGVYTDVMDIDGDGLPDRVTQDWTSPYTEWMVYKNNGHGFDAGVPWFNPSASDGMSGNYIQNSNEIGVCTNVTDINGDGLPDRLGLDASSPYTEWNVFYNNRSSFNAVTTWSNPSAWDSINGNYIQNNNAFGVYTDLVDMNGDGLPDRVVYDKTSPYTEWTVYLNNGSGFDDGVPWPNPSAVDSIQGNYIRNSNGAGVLTDLIDLNGDGLPDRVVYDDSSPYDTWTVYFNNGNGFDAGVSWSNPTAWDSMNGNYIRSSNLWGHYTDVIDLNGDGLPDRVVYDKTSPYTEWTVYLNNGHGFETTGLSWPNPSAENSIVGNYISDNLLWEDNDGAYYNFGPHSIVMDINGDGLLERVVDDKTSPYDTWSVYPNKVPVPDLLYKMDNGIGGTTEITYVPSTAYEDGSGNKLNPYLSSVMQTVYSYTQKDGRGNSYSYRYEYAEGRFDPVRGEFGGFHTVTTYQMATPSAYESKTETVFLQKTIQSENDWIEDYYTRGRIETQTQTSKEGHNQKVENTWLLADTLGGGKFPYLDTTLTTVTDQGDGGPFTYSSTTKYIYDIRPSDQEDQRLNLIQEHKNEGSPEEIVSHFEYSDTFWKKPTKVTVTDAGNVIVSRKWMTYDSSTGNILTEEVCKSDTPNTGCASPNSTQNPVISYTYYSDVNLPHTITDPRGAVTTMNYDSTKTFVYETINCLGHKTTTEYDPATGNLLKLVPPHLQGTPYWSQNIYDVYGRKTKELVKDDSDPNHDLGWTSYSYDNSIGDPNAQYIEKIEHIVGGPSILEHHYKNYYDGMGRTYYERSTGPSGKTIVTETWYDNLGRVSEKSIPYYEGDYTYGEAPGSISTYDGLSRVTDVQAPDGTHIRTNYQGLTKIGTNPRGISTAHTYDILQRLKKVEDANGTVTEYSYDTLGNLIQLTAAKNEIEQNITTVTYDSLSKKKSMTDPDMGNWVYDYDKSGNLTYQRDAKNQEITFQYDCLNRLMNKTYPDRTVTYTYDDPTIPYSLGALTKVSDPSGGELKEDIILEYDLFQRSIKTQKNIGANTALFENTYDSAGRTITIKYPGDKIYSYEYDVAGNLLYVKDNSTGNNLVNYSSFTALGQFKTANYPKPSGDSIKTSYTYHPLTARLTTILTQRYTGGAPAEIYQNLNYQLFDENGNIKTLVDNKNGITHTYTYDDLDRLSTATGAGNNPYTQSFQYDRIGNITYKSDVGSYIYDYAGKPHAVKAVSTDGPISNYPNITLTYDYDNKPSLVKKDNVDYIQYAYDGNGQRIRKQNLQTGQSTLYFGDVYEVRNGITILHIFAGSKRVASVRSDGNTQFYYSNHLGSASVITDQAGTRKQQVEYFPFGTYRAQESPTGTYDYDVNFPNVNFTFTDQEDDDELGLYNYDARIYDPVIGRFLSPDSFVQAASDPQTLNRYSYCRNNPLIYTDPSGHYADLIAYLIVSAVVSIVASSTKGAYDAKRSGGNVWQGATTGGCRAALGVGGLGVIDASMAGAIQAKQAGKSPWAGAGLGGNIAAIGEGINYATRGLTSPFIQSVISIVVSSAGSGLTAAAYGGNPWKAALDSGLTSIAIAGTVQGALALGSKIIRPYYASGNDASGNGKNEPTVSLYDKSKNMRVSNFIDPSSSPANAALFAEAFYNSNGLEPNTHKITGHAGLNTFGGMTLKELVTFVKSFDNWESQNIFLDGCNSAHMAGHLSVALDNKVIVTGSNNLTWFGCKYPHPNFIDFGGSYGIPNPFIRGSWMSY